MLVFIEIHTKTTSLAVRSQIINTHISPPTLTYAHVLPLERPQGRTMVHKCVRPDGVDLGPTRVRLLQPSGFRSIMVSTTRCGRVNLDSISSGGKQYFFSIYENKVSLVN